MKKTAKQGKRNFNRNPFKKTKKWNPHILATWITMAHRYNDAEWLNDWKVIKWAKHFRLSHMLTK